MFSFQNNSLSLSLSLSVSLSLFPHSLFHFLHYAAGPVIIDAPASQQVLVGQDVLLNCTSASEPLHSVVWLFNSSTEIVRYNATTRDL